MYPSKLKQIGIMKTEPGDDNNQDISGDISMLENLEIEFDLDKSPEGDFQLGAIGATVQDGPFLQLPRHVELLNYWEVPRRSQW